MAMGALASGGVRVLNEHVIRSLNVPEEIIASVTVAGRARAHVAAEGVLLVAAVVPAATAAATATASAMVTAVESDAVERGVVVIVAMATTTVTVAFVQAAAAGETAFAFALARDVGVGDGLVRGSTAFPAQAGDACDVLALRVVRAVRTAAHRG